MTLNNTSKDITVLYKQECVNIAFHLEITFSWNLHFSSHKRSCAELEGDYL